MFTVLAAHWFTTNEKLTVSRVPDVLIGFISVAVLIGPDALTGLGSEDLIDETARLFAAGFKCCWHYQVTEASFRQQKLPLRVMGGLAGLVDALLAACATLAKAP
jgi:drug/metabolite transporter (DMT)-like permease